MEIKENKTKETKTKETKTKETKTKETKTKNKIKETKIKNKKKETETKETETKETKIKNNKIKETKIKNNINIIKNININKKKSIKHKKIKVGGTNLFSAIGEVVVISGRVGVSIFKTANGIMHMGSDLNKGVPLSQTKTPHTPPPPANNISNNDINQVTY